MHALVIGSGGREHSIVKSFAESKIIEKIFVSPGNAGTSEIATNVVLDLKNHQAVVQFCQLENIKFVFIGPEECLVDGLCDSLRKANIAVVGPSKKAAQLEGSKIFAKKFMQAAGVPTAAVDIVNSVSSTMQAAKKYSAPYILKADGLAAGKGVVISETHEDALKTFEEMIINKQFGEASAKVVIEEFLDGIETSVFVLTDGKDYKIIGHAKDYKRIGEGDTGLNTGGMGCVSPVPFVDDIFMHKVISTIIEPTVNGLAAENITYKGFIFFGLIKVKNEPLVIEYNCRMGDPETEVVMPRLQNDIIELFFAVHNGTLKDQIISYNKSDYATVVAVSGGYPGDYRKNLKIDGLENLKIDNSSIVFHAGTKQTGDDVVTNGGRVLAVTSYGSNITDAVNKSKKILQQIHFDGMYYRNDIGYEFK